MKMNFRLSVVALGMAFSGSVFAAPVTETFILNQISSPTIAPWGADLGTVTLTQTNADEVDVSLLLSKTAFFVSTGGPHNAFTFNLDLAGSAVALTGSTANDFSVETGSVANAPYGTYTNGILCPACGPGASKAKNVPLTFTIRNSSGLNFNSFTKSTGTGGGYYFSADVLGPSGGTGNIAANVSAVPEVSPVAMLLIGLGLGGILTLISKRRFMIK